MRTEKLPVGLTEAEVQDRNAEVVRLLDQIDEIKEEDSARKSDAKAAILRLEMRASALRDESRSRSQVRDVEVEEVKNYTAERVDIVRNDTGKVVFSRAMRPEEKQRPLPLEASKAPR